MQTIATTTTIRTDEGRVVRSFWDYVPVDSPLGERFAADTELRSFTTRDEFSGLTTETRRCL